jgi:hypothetical protein
MAKYTDDLDQIENKHLAAIGAIATTWAHLEWAADRLIWELADVKQQLGACITSQFGGLHPRLRAVISLVQIRGGSQKLVDALNKFYADSEPLLRKRNRTIHDPWLSDTQTGATVRMEIAADKRLKYDFKPVKTEELISIQGELKAHHVRFERMMDDVLAEMPSWPDISQLLPLKIEWIREQPSDYTSDK